MFIAGTCNIIVFTLIPWMLIIYYIYSFITFNFTFEFYLCFSIPYLWCIASYIVIKSNNIKDNKINSFLAFIISIILPSYYIAITTYNVDFIPINLLINFISQRQSVPSPGFIEALVMLISFEILRESDTRIPSNMGTSISILGGLILGDTLVSAGIISPIMIVVIAISMISSLVFQNMEMIHKKNNSVKGR